MIVNGESLKYFATANPDFRKAEVSERLRDKRAKGDSLTRPRPCTLSAQYTSSLERRSQSQSCAFLNFQWLINIIGLTPSAWFRKKPIIL